jgi:hypothetical protein
VVVVIEKLLSGGLLRRDVLDPDPEVLDRTQDKFSKSTWSRTSLNPRLQLY